MALRRVRSVDEYVGWVRQAVFEMGDLRNCLEYESEDMAKLPAFLYPLEAGIDAVYVEMKDVSYGFGREDLPFMELFGRYSEQIPFHSLRKKINETQRRGLDLDSENA